MYHRLHGTAAMVLSDPLRAQFYVLDLRSGHRISCSWLWLLIIAAMTLFFFTTPVIVVRGACPQTQGRMVDGPLESKATAASA
jgi:hypothetical protein